MGVGIRVGTGTGVNVGGIVLSGCSAAGAGLAWVGDASSGVEGVVGVAVTTTVTTGGASLPQAASVIARLINAVNVRLILSIVLTLLVQPWGARWVWEAVVAAKSPVEGLDQRLAVGGPAEPVVAVRRLAGLK